VVTHAGSLFGRQEIGGDGAEKVDDLRLVLRTRIAGIDERIDAPQRLVEPRPRVGVDAASRTADRHCRVPVERQRLHRAPSNPACRTYYRDPHAIPPIITSSCPN
jgi:hypothetical protein